MTRSELCAHAAVAAGGAVFSAVADSLARGETVTVAGFGRFTARDRAARAGRNPQTGEAVTIAATQVPAFKAEKALRDAYNK